VLVRAGVVSLVLGLGCASVALGGARTGRQYNGPVGAGANNAGVEFGTKLVKGRPTLVRRFEFHNVPAACKGSAGTAVSDPLTITMKIDGNRTFHGSESLNGGRVKVQVSGSFSKSFAKASGTLRARGDVPGCGSADTGILHWKAPRL